MVFRTGRGFRLKGDQHQIHNNLAFANDRADLHISQDKFYGYSADPTGTPTDWGTMLGGRDTSRPQKGNHHSKAHNNATNSYFNPIQNPDDKTGNSWLGTDDGARGTQVQMELRDPGNFDFRPRDYADSPLIDQGTLVQGYTDAITGITDGPRVLRLILGPMNTGTPLTGFRSSNRESPFPHCTRWVEDCEDLRRPHVA